ncbi:MAG: polyprenyl synthetase family protein [Promethearchaeota archaeon]
MIEDFFKTEKQFIDSELEKYFIRLNKQETDLLLKDFITQLKQFIMNEKAKRIHPILLTAAFEGIVNPMYLADQIDQIHEVSIAVELLHSGHIIHDDLLDDDITRRSKPTFHMQLRNELNQVYKDINIPNKNSIINLYGRDMSILGGSQGYLLGLNIIKSSKFPEQLKLLAINEYTEAMNYLMNGMLIEEYLNYHNITLTLEQYLNIAEYQRARLFEKSAKIGAILAKGNIHYQIKPLSDSLLSIGQAHAIRDDILDMEKDILSKNHSKIIYILAIQNTNENQSKRLNEIYHKETLDEKDVKEVKEIFTETNALTIAEHLAKNLVEQAKNNLKDIYPDLNKEQKLFFNEFSDFVYQRTY